MSQLIDENCHSPVVRRVLARKAVEKDPEDLNANLFAPFEQLNVLHRGSAFAHNRQDAVAKTFDARLDRVYPGLVEFANLRFG